MRTKLGKFNIINMEQKNFIEMRPGEQVALVSSAKKNNGVESRFEVKVEAGKTVPTHYHLLFDEYFEVLTGELSVWNGKEKIVLKTGQNFTIKKNVRHKWKNETNGATTFIGSFIPGSISFESLFPFMVGLTKEGQMNKNGMPKSLTMMAYLCVAGDTRFTGGRSIMWPIMRWLYSRAEKKGVYKKILEKYSN